MKEVIAMHGWGGDSNTWQHWSEIFQENGWFWASGERGYGVIPPRMPTWTKLSHKRDGQRRVVIGHSLGPHLLQESILQEATDLVFICSFSRFVPKGVKSNYLKNALKSMQKDLGSPNEAIMLKKFLNKACQPERLSPLPAGPITEGISSTGREILKADLKLLIQSEGLPPGISKQSRVLVIQGDQDRIIDQASQKLLLDELKEHLESEPTYWNIAGVGHALLPIALIAQVHDWLESNQ